MRWPIRNQIVAPFVAVLVAAVASAAVAAAYLAARRSEHETVRQLRAVSQTLAQTNFPLTQNVLEKMRGLSGAHFIVRGDAGGVLESTLPVSRISGLPDDLGKRKPSSLEGYLKLTLGGSDYFAAEIPVQGRSGVRSLLVLYPEASWRQTRWEAAMPPLAIGAGALAVMVVVAFWLAHRFSDRIRQIERQVAAIAEGDFREIEPGSGNDELRELVTSVNRMCEQLRRMQQTIRQSERTQLLGQVAGGLAHQLRNAITGARMAAQIHQKRCRTDQKDESLTVVLRQLALTEEQVKGLLSLGRNEPKQPVPCDVNELIGEVASLVSPACQHTHVDFHHDSEADHSRITGYPDDLRAAVLNLTLNAIEAAGPGGVVRLRVTAEDGSIQLEVSDTGPGPPPELAEKLFAPFVTNKPEGVGLGLALARRVADDHGGRLAWTRDDGQTRFRLVLPMMVEGQESRVQGQDRVPSVVGPLLSAVGGRPREPSGTECRSALGSYDSRPSTLDRSGPQP